MITAEAPPHVTSAPAREEPPEQEPLTLGLWLIVILKAVTALLLWTGFVLLLLAHASNPQDFFSKLVRGLFRGNPPGLAIRAIASHTEFISSAVLLRVALATAVYALVESVEAIGLFMRK